MQVEVDPVLAEVDVYLSQTLGSTLHLFQYPLRPAHLPVQPGSVRSASVRPDSRQVCLKLAIPSHGENYSRSRGEGYARDADMALPPTNTGLIYGSGVMDQHSLTSDPRPPLSHRYVVGVLKDGELHLCPLKAIVQLRPGLQHLDQAAAGRKRSAAAEASTDGGDTTESEGEEAKPVTVKFARRDAGLNRSARVSWSDYSSRHATEEGWQQVDFRSLTSPQADDERRLLFAPDDCLTSNTSLLPEAYLDMLCPVESRPEVRAPSEPPGGAVSLSKLKALPVTRQVHDLLVSTGVLTLGQLCSLLQCGRGQLSTYLDALQRHGILVQGCWVVGSHLLYPTETQASLRNARDYLLYCFTQNRSIARKDVAVITKVPHEAVRQILAPLTLDSGWEFRLPTDTEFLHKYPHIVRLQEEKWRNRMEELRAELNLPREQPKLNKSPSGSEDTRKMPVRRGKVASGIKVEPAEDAQTGPASPPQALEEPMDTSSPQVIVKVEPTGEGMGDGMAEYCRELLANGVHSLADITGRLRVHQGTLGRGHPLGTAVVTEALVEEALIRIAAIEVGKPSGVRLFALPRNYTAADKFRDVVLRLFQNHRWLRRKTIVDEMERVCGHQPDPKTFSSILKELAYSRGSQWYLLGT